MFGHSASLADVAAIEHQPRLLFEVSISPIIDAPRRSEDKFAVLVVAGNPIGVFWSEIRVFWIEDL